MTDFWPVSDAAKPVSGLYKVVAPRKNTAQYIVTQKLEDKLRKPYKCQNCGRGFALKCSKSRHLKYECGHEPRFQCPYCPYRSKQPSPMYAHIRRKHPGKDVFIFDLKLQEWQFLVESTVIFFMKSNIGFVKTIFLFLWSDFVDKKYRWALWRQLKLIKKFHSSLRTV